MTGKSTFIATFPKPMIVFSFDGYLKESPYLDKGFYDDALQSFEDGTPFRDVVDTDGSLLIRIVYLHDEIPERPTAYKRFLALMNGFTALERRNWETVVVDSVSALTRANFMMHQFDLNKDYKDPRKWYADTADYVERIIGRFASMADINVVLAAHVSRKYDEGSSSYLRLIKLPGRLGLDGPDTFPEIYRLYVEPSTGRRLLQTQKLNDSWLAGSQYCRAPNPCEPRYSQLWVNWTPRTRPVLAVAMDAEATGTLAIDTEAGAPASITETSTNE